MFVSNSLATISTSSTRKYTSVSGAAAPRCSERKSRISPRATDTNAGRPGLKRCSHSFENPSRSYHATDRSASSTLSIGITTSRKTSPPILECFWKESIGEADDSTSRSGGDRSKRAASVSLDNFYEGREFAVGEGVFRFALASRMNEIFEAIASAVYFAARDLDRAEILDDLHDGIQAVPRRRVHAPRILALLETLTTVSVKCHARIVHAFDLDHTEARFHPPNPNSLPKNLAVVIVLLYYYLNISSYEGGMGRGKERRRWRGKREK